MRTVKGFTLAAIATAGLAATALVPISARAADVVLSGAVTSAAGEKLGGVAVSAKAEGSTITTTVFTDETGNYYFPPLASGKYRVWAQALTFATAKDSVDLASAKREDFKLSTLQDFERQLPGDLVIASLPDATPDDARLKNLIHNNCTGCHTPNYPLQHKFDETGWSHIIDLMKHVNVSGVYLGPDRVNGVLDFNQKDLAAYLARARGPGETSMKFKLRPRPAGEAARVVYKEYDVPVEADANMPAKYAINDGSDWSLGTPSRIGSLVHDSWADLDGNLWFTSNVPNHNTSIGRIDAQTGAVKMFKVNGQNGMAANTHGMTRDPNGIIWFNAGSVQAKTSLSQQHRTRRPSRSRCSSRRTASTAPAAPPRSTGTARARSGCRRRRACCVSIPTPRPSPNTSPSPTRPRTAPARLTARPAIATATAGGRR